MGGHRFKIRELIGVLSPRWKGGKTITKRGYVRITAGPDRGKYEHRLVAQRLFENNTISPLVVQWDKGLEIHHMDFDHANNLPSNLLVLHPFIHARSSHTWKQRRNGRYLTKCSACKGEGCEECLMLGWY